MATGVGVGVGGAGVGVGVSDGFGAGVGVGVGHGFPFWNFQLSCASVRAPVTKHPRANARAVRMIVVRVFI